MTEGAFHKAPRPLMMWVGLITAAVAAIGLSIFLYRVGNAIATAYERAASADHSVPDMSGGLPALITALVGLGSAVMVPVINVFTARNRQRYAEEARGTAPPPFVPPERLPPSPDGGGRPGDSP